MGFTGGSVERRIMPAPMSSMTYLQGGVRIESIRRPAEKMGLAGHGTEQRILDDCRSFIAGLLPSVVKIDQAALRSYVPNLGSDSYNPIHQSHLQVLWEGNDFEGFSTSLLMQGLGNCQYLNLTPPAGMSLSMISPRLKTADMLKRIIYREVAEGLANYWGEVGDFSPLNIFALTTDPMLVAQLMSFVRPEEYSSDIGGPVRMGDPFTSDESAWHLKRMALEEGLNFHFDEASWIARDVYDSNVIARINEQMPYMGLQGRAALKTFESLRKNPHNAFVFLGRVSPTRFIAVADDLGQSDVLTDKIRTYLAAKKS